jgi:hypothetical protein
MGYHIPEVMNQSTAVQWCHWFWCYKRSKRELFLCRTLPAQCLQGVSLPKVCTYSKSGLFYHWFWSHIWFDNIHSMRALLGKQTLNRLVNVMWGVPYHIAQGEGNNEDTERKFLFSFGSKLQMCICPCTYVHVHTHTHTHTRVWISA